MTAPDDSASPLALPPKPRVLVVALRRLGDVLLTTPLIRSMRRAWPDATLDVLVFADTAGILDGNSDVDRIISMPARPTLAQSLRVAARLFQRYDVAVSTQSGDRPTAFALLAGRTHAGPVWPGNWIKRILLSRAVPAVEGVHRVEEMLRIADALAIARRGEVVSPAGILAPEHAIAGPYAVIHAAPMFRYKQWTREGWRALADALRQRGLAIVTTGGPDDRAYLDDVWRDDPDVRRLDGRLRWAEVAALLRGARLYVGPDTSVTHLAAASGCPTVALFGPTDPRLWGPWPARGLPTPWAASGTIQCRHNVWLVQNPLPCMPCQNEGCDKRLDSRAQCLDELAPRQVLAAAAQALASQPER
ncbi:MAG TPA: glycosyltransferase family 9 protein [Xanthobacteraceae bacterium]|jgi:heptosyltransferase-3|nr:glycosyltransferase family 9 protein [Xanthobacteraceae bacterium]